MEHVVANVAGRVRQASLLGRPHLVAPLTMIVSGVLNGSRGPLYYPPEEVTKDPDTWNHMPIVVYHPTKAGVPVSARSPDILNSHCVGVVLNARGHKGRLKAEGWFDIEATRRVDSRVLESLESGQKIELSTGLFLTQVPAEPEPAGGQPAHNGQPYDWVAINYKPDHLAVLPDQVGACSLADGCGVLVNWAGATGPCETVGWQPAEGPRETEVCGLARASHKAEGCGCKAAGACGCKTKPAAASTAPVANPYVKEHAARMTHPGKFKKDSFRRIKVAPGVSAIIAKRPGKNKTEVQAYRFDAKKFTPAAARRWLMKKRLTPIMFEKAAVANSVVANSVPKDVSLDDYQYQVYKAFRQAHPVKYDPNDGTPQNYCYVVAVFDGYVIYEEAEELYRHSFKAGKGGVEFEGQPEKVRRVSKYEVVGNVWRVIEVPKLQQAERQAIIDDLAANHESWRGAGDKEILATLPDDKLVALKGGLEKERQLTAIANAAAQGYRDGNTAYRVNPETGKWEKGEVTGNAGAGKGKQAPPGPAVDEDDDDDDDDDDGEERRPRRRKKKAKAPSANRAMTTEEILRNLPPDLQTMLANAQHIERQEKEKLAAQLLANVNPADKAAQYEWLVRQPLDDLRRMLALMPAAPTPEEAAQAAAVANRQRRVADDDVLRPPTINWHEADQGGNNGGTNGTAGAEEAYVEAYHGPSLQEDEWLRNAPPSVRNSVINARLIENREKQGLINHLVGNVTDDDEERRLRRRFEAKSLDELKDLVAIMGGRAPAGRPNFVGAAPILPPTMNSPRVSPADEQDVLPLPRINWQEASAHRGQN